MIGVVMRNEDRVNIDETNGACQLALRSLAAVKQNPA